MPFQAVTVRVPASTSNLGSGFDTLGLAVQLYNRITVRRNDGDRIVPAWTLAPEDVAWFEHALQTSGELFFRTTRQRAFGAEVFLSGDVPVARGLGASATVRVGVLAALNELSGAKLPRASLLDLATELEGHPDNASPAIYGGFTVSGRVSDSVSCQRFPVSPKLRLVTLIPHFGISTEVARKLLPKTYWRGDAAHALNRAALITAALASGRYEALRGLFDDRMHQPYRERLLPQLSDVIRAGENAGALGGFLSGSGSSIICLTTERPEAVGRAMRRVLPDAVVKMLRPDNAGFKVFSTRGKAVSR